MTSNSYRDQMNTIPQFNYQNDLQNAPQNYNKFGLPPRNAVMKKKQHRKNMHGSRMRQGGSRAPSKPGWDDSFAKKEDNKIPEYYAVKDHFAQGYVGQLKKHGNYKRYINELARGASHKQRLRSVMDSRQPAGLFFKHRRITVGPSSSQ